MKIDGTRAHDRATELVLAYYAAFNRGDWAGMQGLLADDVVHDLNQPVVGLLMNCERMAYLARAIPVIRRLAADRPRITLHVHEHEPPEAMAALAARSDHLVCACDNPGCSAKTGPIPRRGW